MRCPVFDVMSAAYKLDAELSYLDEALSEQLKTRGLAYEEPKWESESETDSGHWTQWGATLIAPIYGKAKGKSGGKRPHTTLSIRFDMYRPVTSSQWAHREDALLVVGYWPGKEKDDAWLNDHLMVTEFGRLLDDIWDDCKLDRDSGNRLIVWPEKKGASWSKRAWIFALPMKELKDVDHLVAAVVDPVAKLLNDVKPEFALHEKAVAWSDDVA